MQTPTIQALYTIFIIILHHSALISLIIAKGMYNLSIRISDVTDNPIGETVSHAKRAYKLSIQFKFPSNLD